MTHPDREEISVCPDGERSDRRPAGNGENTATASAYRDSASGDDGMTALQGTVEKIIFSNEENGYAVVDIGSDEEGVATACGILPYISEGESVVLWGHWITTVKYGRQFKAEKYERDMPAGSEAILRYLSSRSVKGIGPKTAQRIVDMFGDDTLDVMENHPEWLTEIPGISRRKAEEIAEDFRAKAGIRSAMLFFREYFGAAMTVRIYKQFGGNAVEIARNNPYRLCDEVSGIGFERADRMAMSLGLSENSDERLQSGLSYVLNYNAVRNGHTCLPEDKLIGAGAALLHVDEVRVGEALRASVQSKRLISRTVDGRRYIYTDKEDRAERYVAEKLCLIHRLCPAVDGGDIEAFLQREEREQGIVYAKEQRKAMEYALSYGVMILTGGPGTGKTTVVRALLTIFTAMDMKVALCAPTGRAAKRLSESTSAEARTIHRLLEMDFREGEGHGHFRRNEEDLLEEDVIIADEASMIDNELMYALLRAVKPGARLILIGDDDQLPSVGAGRVLNDILESGRFATVRLTEIFRQARESLIVTNAHAVNEGRMPDLSVKDNDFFFLPRRTDAEVAATVVSLCETRLPRAYGESTRDGIQVISPSRKGEAGTENLNRLLQQALNPRSGRKREMTIRDTVFRVGDRVMQTKNNYEIEWTSEEETAQSPTGNGVFNGDIGVITDMDPTEKTVTIRFDDRETVYTSEQTEELEHAWAVTVHKSQGSEYPFVIIPLFSSSPMLLTRNLLYTAITRAKRMVILVGREEMIARMVQNHRQSMRYTGLADRLREG